MRWLMRPRDLVALVLAASAGLAILLLTAAGLWDAFQNPDSQLSEAYSSLLTGTLGVLVGALAGYIGGHPSRHNDDYDDDTDPPTRTDRPGSGPDDQEPR